MNTPDTARLTARARLVAYLQQAGLSTARAEANIDALLDEERPAVSSAGRAALLHETADKAALLLDVAAECNKAGGAYAERGAVDAAGAAFTLMETFLRQAGEAEYVATPCSGPVPCEDGGEPCDVHERLMGHVEGDHELCGPDCGQEWLRRVAAEEQPAETQDALPAWLYQRFMPDGVGWEHLDADDRSYWEHQARAVRRAVARGGFRPATERPVVGEQPEMQETREAGQ